MADSLESKAQRLTARHYATGRAVRVEIAGGRISSVSAAEEAATKEPLPWIAPGFIDIQSNGYNGQEFSAADLTPEKVAEIARRQREFGVTRFCPTVTTASRETIVHAMNAIDQACRAEADVAYTVAGIHLEGPYISRADGPRGAHPLDHCREPDWREFEQFQKAAGGRIKLVTLSPEHSGAADFIRHAVATGVVVAIGHTSANSEQIGQAVAAGARLSTHLGNGAHRELRRHPNYIWDQLADDRLMASLIVDGHHLPREVVQTFVRAKTAQRCILVSDLSGLAGLPPGRYAAQMCELEILPDGRLVIAGQDQLLAGAAQPISVGVANVVRFAGVDLATAVHMASRHPAQLLSLPVVSLQPGDPADLVVFDFDDSSDSSSPRLRVRATISAGISCNVSTTAAVVRK